MENNGKIIIMLGKAGCGKGTQSELLKNKYKLFPISTGELIRNYNGGNEEIIKAKEECSKKGILIPDNVIIKIVLEKINEVKKNGEYKGFIFDGFPRTAKQMEVLADTILPNPDVKIISYEIDDEKAIERMKGRAVKDGNGARDDDKNEDSRNRRLAEYHKNYPEILKVIDRYKNEITFIEVDAAEKEKEIFEETVKCIDSKTYLNNIHNPAMVAKAKQMERK